MPPKSKSIADVTDWLDNDFIASFERDVDLSIWRPPFVDASGRPHHRGFFAIALLSLAYCEAMTVLINSNPVHSVDVCKFIEDEVSAAAPQPSSVRYKSRGTLLFNVYRHRLAHQREPGQLDVNGTAMLWQINRGMARADHLLLKQDGPTHQRFTIDAEHLRDDALGTFKRLRGKVSAGDQALADRIYDRALWVHNPKPPGTANAYVLGQLANAIATPDP